MPTDLWKKDQDGSTSAQGTTMKASCPAVAMKPVQKAAQRAVNTGIPLEKDPPSANVPPGSGLVSSCVLHSSVDPDCH